MKTITIEEAKQRLAVVIVEVTKALPFERGEQAKEYFKGEIEAFVKQPEIRDSLYIEFGTSFHVTCHLNITLNRYGDRPRFEATATWPSSTRTMAQAMAAHSLNGDVLKAAAHIQAAADGLPEIESYKERKEREKSKKEVA